ncbi:MAG: ester cyclase [Roseiflexaceae bacterium]
MAEGHNAMLVRRAVEEIWNRGQLDVADVLFAEDYINHAGLIPDFVRGPEAIKISIAFYRTAFPNFQITIDALTAQRDAVVLRWTARSAPSVGNVASAMPGTLAGIIVSRVAGGQIVESWAYWDQASVLARLGRHHANAPDRAPTPRG